ncbi:hypothetical protein V6R21_17860 [Limibacter armeniacum]|uniref:hypothetical protein n=1 Tax=Limibacter armeniacum TaxID=466084 RepID=UPI002FE63A0A
MKRIFKVICLLLIVNLYLSCDDDDTMSIIAPSEGDYMIFGTSYGFCAGNCTNLFLLKDSLLFEDDDVERGIPDTVPFKEEPLEHSSYDIAKVLWNELPQELLSSNDTVFGCPDCADQGAIYLKLRLEGQIYEYRIDTYDEQLPEFLIPFSNKVEEITKTLVDSSSSKTTLKDEQLVFGLYYGECLGNCTHLYLIDNEMLYQDDSVTYIIPEQVPFKPEALPSESYEMAKILLAEFPSALLNETDSIFGCPDCADQGGIFIRYSYGDKTRTFRIDTNDNDLPEYLIPYSNKVESITSSLSQP